MEEGRGGGGSAALETHSTQREAHLSTRKHDLHNSALLLHNVRTAVNNDGCAPQTSHPFQHHPKHPRIKPLHPRTHPKPLVMPHGKRHALGPE